MRRSTPLRALALLLPLAVGGLFAACTGDPVVVTPVPDAAVDASGDAKPADGGQDTSTGTDADVDAAVDADLDATSEAATDSGVPDATPDGGVASGIAAYAWADDMATASYTPNATYSYNSAGGAITATRSAVGIYAITFAGLTIGSGDVQVTAYGGNRHCNVQNWTGSTVNVRCYDAANAPADSRYDVAVVLNNIVTNARVAAYAWANDMSTASYTPNASYSYNSGGGAITAARTAAGTYTMTFAGLTISSGDMQVSAYGSNRNCNVQSWGTSTVNVRCYDNAGTLADSLYTVTVILNTSSTATVLGYAWADQSGTASYAPSATFAYNSAGQAMTATRTAAGTYAMAFTGLTLSNGNVKVSAYGSSSVCNVQNWTGTTVNVRCYDSANALVDSRYTVLVTK